MKCKDFNIIKIRYFASEYHVKKWMDGGKQPTQHWNRAQEMTKFFWLFFEQVTGENTSDFYLKNKFGQAKEIALELFETQYGIFIEYNGNGWCVFYIPVINTDLFEWCLNNIKNPYKVVKRTHLPFYIKRI